MQPLIDTAEALHAVLPLLAPHAAHPDRYRGRQPALLFREALPHPDQRSWPRPADRSARRLSARASFRSASTARNSSFTAPTTIFACCAASASSSPPRVFDTMIAARLCGIAEFSLAALIKRYFGVATHQGFAKSQLGPAPALAADGRLRGQRHPLSPGDRRHPRSRTHAPRSPRWFHQCCGKAVAASAITKERDPEEVWRITGSKDLRGRASAILRALWHWREAEAQAIDRPTFHILHSEQLIEAAARFDRDQDVDFSQLHGAAPPALLRGRGKGQGAARERMAEDHPQTAPPPHARRGRAAFASSRRKRDAAATELSSTPPSSPPRACSKSLAANAEETAARMLPWQRATLGI